MLFNTLDRFKRKMLLMIILLMFTGLTLFLVPVPYIPMLGKSLGFVFLVLSVLKILEFTGSNKAMIHYINPLLFLMDVFLSSSRLPLTCLGIKKARTTDMTSKGR
ncbi:MAG: hypothetical protein IKE58_11915 [Blautia sp.]|nr:hypothetical protein [Blautia sp.]